MDPERRGLCQAPDTRMWLNARKVEDETSYLFARKQPVGKVECLAFQRTIPRLLNPTTRPSGPMDRPDLERILSRSATLDRSQVRSRMTGGKSGLPGAVSDGQSLTSQAIHCVAQSVAG